jgi:hypothetical protein
VGRTSLRHRLFWAALVAAACSASQTGPGPAQNGTSGAGAGGAGSGASTTGSGVGSAIGSGSVATGSSAGSGDESASGLMSGAASGSGSGGGAASSDASLSDATAVMTTSDGAASADGAGPASDAGPSARRSGNSAGCSLPPNGATVAAFTNHRISIPPCAACTIPNCPQNCIAPPFVPGGVSAQTAPNGENFVNRDFAIELPADYDPTVAYPVYFGADGCSAAPPPEMGPGFTPGGVTGAIQVGLQQINGCFADGGVQCASVQNVAQCVNSPELPYFLAVRDWVEANFCVDRSSEFLGGLSSGAWLASTLGCAEADSLRGIVSVAGGKREHRWPCDGGSVAALMVVSEFDTTNPVGPLQTLNTGLDSYGSAPARDDLLARNGCVGTATAPYDPKFPVCVTYTGCPAAYPVVWCELGTGSHAVTGFNGVNYAAAMWPFLTGLPSTP